MFCPICRSEYREGFSKCSDCGVPLVPELPVEQHEFLNFIHVMSVANEGDLCVIKSVFDANGIKYCFKGDIQRLSTELMVFEEDITNAREILKELNLL